MFMSLLSAERMKLKNMYVWLIFLASPILTGVIGFSPSAISAPNQWMVISTQMILAHSALFLPLLTGIFAALVCYFEHSDGGWKQLLALPVQRIDVFVAKYTIVMILLLLAQLFFGAAIFVVGTIQGIKDPFLWNSILFSCFMGWLSCFPLAALQFWLSAHFTSFAGPTAINVILSLPAILIANSELLGPLYPWAHPLLSMTQAFSVSLGGDAGFLANESGYYSVLIGSFLLFIIAGGIYFQRKQWT